MSSRPAMHNVVAVAVVEEVAGKEAAGFGWEGHLVAVRLHDVSIKV